MYAFMREGKTESYTHVHMRTNVRCAREPHTRTYCKLLQMYVYENERTSRKRGGQGDVPPEGRPLAAQEREREREVVRERKREIDR